MEYLAARTPYFRSFSLVSVADEMKEFAFDRLVLELKQEVSNLQRLMKIEQSMYRSSKEALKIATDAEKDAELMEDSESRREVFHRLLLETKQEVSNLQRLMHIEQGMLQTSNQALRLAVEALDNDEGGASEKRKVVDDLEAFDEVAKEYADTVATNTGAATGWTVEDLC